MDKEEEKQGILEDTKELTEKNAKIAEKMEKMNQELKNVEKYGLYILFMYLILFFPPKPIQGLKQVPNFCTNFMVIAWASLGLIAFI